MWMLNLLFNMNGRIGRRDWWIGTLTSFVLAMAFYYVAMRMLGLTETVANIMALVFVYPGLALMLKRFADLHWPRWPAYAISALSAAVQVIPMPEPSDKPAIFTVWMVVVLAIAVTQIVVCGFFKGKLPQDTELRAQHA